MWGSFWDVFLQEFFTFIHKIMTKDLLNYLFTLTARLTKRNLTDITEEDALITVNGSSSANWIVGHIVLSRSDLLEEIGVERHHTKSELQYYIATHEQEVRVGEALTLETLVKKLLDCNEKFCDSVWSKLESITGDDYMKMEKAIHFMHFHESYHVGQLGLMRRVIGKEGMIR